MTHFGTICTAGSHLNPMTILGYELLRRGHHLLAMSTGKPVLAGAN